MGSLFFSSFNVTSQAFFRTTSSYAIVNLKPIVRGHVLVAPIRVVPRLSDLTPDEVSALFSAVQIVGRGLEKAYSADGLTIACQDGKAAGQTVAHVHIHILPRHFKKSVDPFAETPDAIYPALEASEGALPGGLAASLCWMYVCRTARADQMHMKKAAEREPEVFKVDADEARKPRSAKEMEEEATWLRGFFTDVQ